MHSASDPILHLQLPHVAWIIEDETWLEGERRGCPVSPDDPVVRENICGVILRIGAQLCADLAARLGGSGIPPSPATLRSFSRLINLCLVSRKPVPIHDQRLAIFRGRSLLGSGRAFYLRYSKFFQPMQGIGTVLALGMVNPLRVEAIVLG